MHEYGSSEYNRLIPASSRQPGSRAAIVVDVYQVGSVSRHLLCIRFRALVRSETRFAGQSCGYAVPLYDFVMHRTQLLRMSDKVESMDRALAASRDRQEHDPTGDGGDRASKDLKPQMTLRSYWLLKNMTSLDGLPGLVTAPDAILGMVPQNNFDRDSPRPMLPVRRSTELANTVRDFKWLASGFVLGAVAVLTITTLAGSKR